MKSLEKQHPARKYSKPYGHSGEHRLAQTRKRATTEAIDPMLVRRKHSSRQAKTTERTNKLDRTSNLSLGSNSARTERKTSSLHNSDTRKRIKTSIANPKHRRITAATRLTNRSAPQQTSKKRKHNSGSKLFSKSNVIYAMAIVLFIVGMGVAFQGYRANTKTDQQVAILHEAVESVHNGEPNGIATSLPNEKDITHNDISSYVVSPEKPRYFRAPTIGINTTRILETGLTSNGNVATPAGIYDVSWYNKSASITDNSGAVFIVGHYVGPHQAGIFWRLKNLKPGDIVEVEQGDGTVSKFKVIDKTNFKAEHVDMHKALTPVNPNKLGLNLMTCAGKWDMGIQQYDERTLVRAEKI